MAEMYGTFELEVWGKTLVVKLTGPLGLEEVVWLQDQMAAKYLKYLSKPWAILGDAREWELYTPEVKDKVEEFSNWVELQGMRFNVILVPENSVKRSAAKDLVLVGEVEHCYRSSKEEAVEWLTEKNLWGERKI